ncbi:hypothetical protein CPB85DRAFT_789553 [Mucidula mucida]|nr:hypothetical protein CPB85DRAFT_789553 [Mucidula mucida]
MQLTFVNDMGQSFVVEIDPNMELENVTALLEVDSGIPQSEQILVYEGRQLTDAKATSLRWAAGPTRRRCVCASSVIPTSCNNYETHNPNSLLRYTIQRVSANS